LRGVDAPRDDIPEWAIAFIKRRMPFAMCFSTVLSETFMRRAVSRFSPFARREPPVPLEA